MLCIFNRLKKILLLFIVLTLTGCTATYNLTIDDMKDVKESLDITENNKELFKKQNEDLSGSTLEEYLETNLKWPTPIDVETEINPLEPIKIDGANYYDKENISTDSQLGIRYKYNFKVSEFGNSNILNTCYEYKYNINNNVATFETTSNFKCFEEYPMLDEVRFKLNSQCKIINSNETIKNNNVYTWVIKKDKHQNIKFAIDCNPKKNKVEVPFVVVVPIYALLVGLGVMFLKASYSIHNKI